MPWNARSQGPPDLGDLFRRLLGRFGGTSGGGGRGLSIGAWVLLAVATLVWLGSGFYIVTDGMRGLELRFGKYNRTTLPGPHWHIPWPIEDREIVNVQLVRSTTHTATMLTQDENIVVLALAGQFRVKDAHDYAFNVRNPDFTLKQAMGSALREVVGKSKIDYILFEGRADIASRTKQLMQEILDAYQTGLLVTQVTLQQAQPPDPVKASFDDVTKSREDNVRFVNEAEAYANSVIPQARGAAARRIQEADGYRDKVIAEAEGEADRFLKILKEYARAPAVTRDRLYLEAVESVLSNSSKVMVDVKGGNNLLLLQLDKLIQENTMGASPTDTGGTLGNPSPSSGDMLKRQRRDTRTREGRQ